MFSDIKFRLKQYIKLLSQSVVLPVVYRCCKGKAIDEDLVVFADAHHTNVPFSMEDMRTEMKKRGYHIVDMYNDYQAMGPVSVIKNMSRFMKYYARARYVFICDNFLPVASCRKRKETTVVQLWHAGGILKKYAYDTTDDIPSYYKKNVFANYDFLSVSSECCIPVYNRAMRQPEGVVQATGLSRTDRYFNKEYKDRCVENFYHYHPEAKGKKVIVWAPTFRGKASNPYMIGLEKMKQLARENEDKWYLVIKAHPHMDAKHPTSTSDIPTEQLFPVADLLVTDYSSVIFDYVLMIKPMVLFVPDIEEFSGKRGLYIDFDSIPGRIVTDEDKLKAAIETELSHFDSERTEKFAKEYMGACDGYAIERICKAIGAQKLK